jgi:hypothetical protein
MMAVYVDALSEWSGGYRGDAAAQAKRVGSCNGHRWCHMLSDGGDDELHAFAARIGLKRSWFQGDHYDLTPSRREKAVRLGAVEADRRTIVNIRRANRGLPPIGAPLLATGDDGRDK